MAEDNRDIFDKALDALPAVGVVAGGAIGRKLGRRAAAKSWSQAFGKDMTVARKNAMRADVTGAGRAGIILGAPAGLVAGGATMEAAKKYRKK